MWVAGTVMPGGASARAQRRTASAAMPRPAHARSETDYSAVTHDRDDPAGAAGTPRRLRQHQPSVPPGKIVGPGDQALASPDS